MVHLGTNEINFLLWKIFPIFQKKTGLWYWAFPIRRIGSVWDRSKSWGFSLVLAGTPQTSVNLPFPNHCEIKSFSQEKTRILLEFGFLLEIILFLFLLFYFIILFYRVNAGQLSGECRAVSPIEEAEIEQFINNHATNHIIRMSIGMHCGVFEYTRQNLNNCARSTQTSDTMHQNILLLLPCID